MSIENLHFRITNCNFTNQTLIFLYPQGFGNPEGIRKTKSIKTHFEMPFNKSKYPQVIITQEMIEEAKRLIAQTRVNRTIASKIDTLTGHLGEFVFAEYFFDDWHKHHVGQNKGASDFEHFEIKTSAYPFSDKLNLLVREDYARKRHPDFYVQIIIDVPSKQASEILPGTPAYICGYATSKDVDTAPLRDFGSKLADKGGYKCRFINIKNLKPIAVLRLH